MKERFCLLNKGTYVLLATAFVSSLSLLIYQIYTIGDQVTFWGNILVAVFVLLIYVGFLALAMRSSDRRSEKAIIVTSVLFLCFNIFEFLVSSGILVLPGNAVVENFYGKDISEVAKWAEEKNVALEQVYVHSETMEKYKVLAQDVEPGTLVKKITKLVVTVSDGPDEEVELTVPNMIGWNLDEALAFLKENHFTNVTIDFEYSSKEKDTIIKQSISSAEIKRNEAISLVSSLGEEGVKQTVKMEDLVGLDLFHATIFLRRNDLNYEIQYVYREEEEENTVVSQSVDEGVTVSNQDEDPIIIAVVKKEAVTVPHLEDMDTDDIEKWAKENQLSVEFEEAYDDTIASGKVISSTIIAGEIVKPNSSFQVTISKGPLKMIAFDNVDDFRKWAEENEVTYHIDYQFSNTVANGKLISSSHEEGEIIKNKDTVRLVISQGGNTTIPNFVGKTKAEAEDLCEKHLLRCNFQTASSTREKDTVIKQSMRSGSTVPQETSITLTLSQGQ